MPRTLLVAVPGRTSWTEARRRRKGCLRMLYVYGGRKCSRTRSGCPRCSRADFNIDYQQHYSKSRWPLSRSDTRWRCFGAKLNYERCVSPLRLPRVTPCVRITWYYYSERRTWSSTTPCDAGPSSHLSVFRPSCTGVLELSQLRFM